MQYHKNGLPWWLSSKEYAYNARDASRRCRFNPWSRKIPWTRKWQHTPVFLPGKSHGQRSLVGYGLAIASACNAGDLGLIPGLGRSLGEGNGNPLQYCCLENSMD